MRSLIRLFKSQIQKQDGAYTYGIRKMEDRKRVVPGQLKQEASHRLKLRIPKAYNELIDNATDDATIEVEYETLVGSVTIHNVTIRS